MKSKGLTRSMVEIKENKKKYVQNTPNNFLNKRSYIFFFLKNIFIIDR